MPTALDKGDDRRLPVPKIRHRSTTILPTDLLVAWVRLGGPTGLASDEGFVHFNYAALQGLFGERGLPLESVQNHAFE